MEGEQGAFRKKQQEGEEYESSYSGSERDTI